MKQTALALLAVVSVAAHAEIRRYIAMDADSSASQLVSRWAALDGRAGKWNPTGDYPLHNAARLNTTGTRHGCKSR